MSAYLVISTQIKTVSDSKQNEDTNSRLFHSGVVAVWLQHQQLGGLQQLFNQVTRELQAVCLFLHECVTLQDICGSGLWNQSVHQDSVYKLCFHKLACL